VITRDVSLRATTHGFEPTKLAARISEFGKRDRARRALRRFLPCSGWVRNAAVPPTCCGSWVHAHRLAARAALPRAARDHGVAAAARLRQREPGATCDSARDPALSGCGAFLKLEEVRESAGSSIRSPECRSPPTPHRCEHGGAYRFCNPRCLAKFQAEPDRYLAPKPGRAPADAIYTCPMHPEIRHLGPGSCPICGMALEPLEVSLEEPENPELRDMSRRFWTSAVLTTPLFALAMSEMLPGMPLQHAVSPALLAGYSSRRDAGLLRLAVLRPRLDCRTDSSTCSLIALEPGWRGNSVVKSPVPGPSRCVPRARRAIAVYFRPRR
jgi:hypothetical protein